MNPIGLLFIAAGAFSLVAAVCDWDWFMNARKARFMVNLLTRNGARVFYSLLGLALLVLGILTTAGVVSLSR
jgi:hypothetical protein